MDPAEGSPPMTPVAAHPVAAEPQLVTAYLAALAALPADVVAEALARLDAAERAGDAGAVRHLLDSLLMTARLSGNEAYVRAVATADAAEAAGGEAPEDVGEFVARMRATHEG